jgi:bacillolysin
MKHSNRARVVRAVTGAGAVTVLLAGTLLSSTTTASASGTEGFGAGTTVDRSDETGSVSFIGSRPGKPIESGFSAGTPAGVVATSFLGAHAKELGLGDGSLAVTEKHATPGGGTSVRVGQSFRGVPVLGAGFVVNLDAAHDVLSVLGEASPIVDAATKPTVGAGVAAASAVARVAKDVKAAESSLEASTPQLMFYDPRLLSAPGPFQSARLAWVTEVRGKTASDIGQQVVVDAATGTVALAFETIAHAKNRIVCDANNTSAQYPCTAPVWTEGNTPAGQDADVATAYNFAGDTYDFYFSRFGRDSLDGAGLQLKSTIDYCDPTQPCPFQNAFWDGAQMVYGDGFAAADDVVGHELTHGFTEFTSHLFYYMQSGAINESMSDVFGEYIDLTNTSGTDTPAVRWQLGEDIPVFGAIRNMQDPTLFNDPDRMLSPNYTADPGETDGGGVHSNSGVNNKAAYLMADGGLFNGQTITGLGITKAARIYYTVETGFLGSASDYADLANALRQACTNLAATATDGITAADCVEVNKIVLATEMDQNPTAAPTSTAAVCPTGTPINKYYDNLEINSGQFVTAATVGTNAWAYPQNPNALAGFDATYATSGKTNIWGYDRPSTADYTIRMANSVVVPQGGFLHFNHSYGFEDGLSAAYDGGVLEYSTAGAAGPWTDSAALFGGGGAGGYNGTISAAFGNPLGGRPAFVRESNGYGASRADLSSLAGQSVMFRWRIGTDVSADDYGWFIDDVRIYACGPDTTPPDTAITSGPANGSTIPGPTATFGFTASEVGSTFRCKVDTGAYAACTTPYTTATLTSGPHTFSVAAVDTSGNVDPTPATRTFTVADSTAPNTKITKHPKKKSHDRDAKFRFTSSESGSTFECKLDGKLWKSCSSPKKYQDLDYGKHTFKVRATDAAGNRDATPDTFTWKIVRKHKKG